MARISVVSFIILLILASCAQVGVISGGEKDVIAPRLIDEKTSPSANSTFFTAQEVKLTFDEYIKLANPSENIFMVPPHATVQAKVRKKTLVLSWNDSLKANTTYSIYLNGAVKDITVGNDSVYQYVFSTGSMIDSLSYTTHIRDAVTDAPQKNYLLLLYDPNEELISMARSDIEGRVTVSNLPSGKYRVLALEDKNNNRRVDPDEKIGFPTDSILMLDSVLIDKQGIRVFSPEPKKGIRTATYNHPTIGLGINGSLKELAITLNGVTFPASRIYQTGTDSLLLFPVDSLSGSVKLSLRTADFEDSVSIRIPAKKTQVEGIRLKQAGVLSPKDTLTLFLNSWVLGAEKSAIRLISLPDSTTLDFTVHYRANELYVVFDQNKSKAILFKTDSTAVRTELGRPLPLEKTFQLKKVEDFGIIKLDLSAYLSPIVLQIFRSGRLYESHALHSTNELLELNYLEPGDYAFQVILDENENGKWDPGNLELLRQAEKIDKYSTPVKVRANWEIEVPLIPKRQEDE